MNRRLALGSLFIAFLTAAASSAAAAIVVNECATGTSGWIELLNTGSVPADFMADPARCWLVDDSPERGAPKRITDATLVHAPGATTCSVLGRPSTCAVLGPGERAWVKYAFVNAASSDECRLVTAPSAGTGCGPALTVVGTAGKTTSRTAGQCFGRQPDGAGWSITAIGCTQGTPNVSCVAGAACSDGSPCTSGEVFSATCACGGGTPTTGANCGGGGVCQSGRCVVPAPDAAPAVVRAGTSERKLLRGTVVTPTDAFDGEVLTEADGKIFCVAPSCAAQTPADAWIIQTNGIILPGLVDTHNHALFNIFDASDWTPAEAYGHHGGWKEEPRYKALVDAKQWLNGEGSPVSIGCELNKYAEIRAIVTGTTSMLGMVGTGKACMGSLARSLGVLQNGLGADKIQTNIGVPRTAASADTFCRNMSPEVGKTDALVIHIAEGAPGDPTARKELQQLWDKSTSDGCLFGPKTTIVHGSALLEEDLDRLQAHQMSLVWSPSSNVFLYGGGTDLTKTLNVPAALEREITIALGPDWNIGLTGNLLDELRFADQVDDAVWGNALTPKALTEMVTWNAARVLALEHKIGMLAPGLHADVLVIRGDRTKPHEALLAARPADIRLVLVGGRALYGDAALREIAQAAPPCDTVNVCGAGKFLCVAQPGTAASKLGQDLTTIKSVIARELQAYDDRNVSQWDFSPLADIWRCGP